MGEDLSNPELFQVSSSALEKWQNGLVEHKLITAEDVQDMSEEEAKAETENRNYEMECVKKINKSIPPTLRNAMLHCLDESWQCPDGVKIDPQNSNIEISPDKCRLGGIAFPKINGLTTEQHMELVNALLINLLQASPDTLITQQEAGKFCSFVSFGDEVAVLSGLSDFLANQAQTIINEKIHEWNLGDITVNLEDCIMISVGKAPQNPAIYTLMQGIQDNYLLAQSPFVDDNSIKGALVAKGLGSSVDTNATQKFRTNCSNGLLPLILCGETEATSAKDDPAIIDINFASKKYVARGRQISRDEFRVENKSWVDGDYDLTIDQEMKLSQVAVGNFWSAQQFLNLMSEEQKKKMAENQPIMIELNKVLSSSVKLSEDQNNKIHLTKMYDLSGLSKMQRIIKDQDNSRDLSEGMSIVMREWQCYCIQMLQSNGSGVDELGGDGCRGLHPDINIDVQIYEYLNTSLKLATSFEDIMRQADTGKFGEKASQFAQFINETFIHGGMPIVKVAEEVEPVSVQVLTHPDGKVMQILALDEKEEQKNQELLDRVKQVKYDLPFNNEQSQMLTKEPIVAIGSQLFKLLAYLSKDSQVFKEFELITQNDVVFLRRIKNDEYGNRA